MVARAARSAYATSPYLVKVLSATVGSIFTAGTPTTVPPPLWVTELPESARIPACALSNGAQEVQPAGVWSNPSTVDPPETLSPFVVVREAWMSIRNGRIVV